MSVEERVLELAREHVHDADLNTSVRNIDSLGLVEIVMAIEDEFDIEVADEEIGRIATPADIVSLIKSRT